MKMGRKCRIWWPRQLSSTEQSSHSLLFGWIVCCSSISLDVVVAFVCDQASFSHCQSSIHDILHETNKKMPVCLQDKSAFALVGNSGACLSTNDEASKIVAEKDDLSKMKAGNVSRARNSRSCGCCKLDDLLENSRHDCIKSGNWIQMVYDFQERGAKVLNLLPKLHHIHWNGKIVSHCDVHIISYETPAYGAHHFSLSSWNSCLQVKSPLKKPKWVDELQQKQPLNDMDTVILAINCASAAKLVHERSICSEASAVKFSVNYMMFSCSWKILAAILASVSTLFYLCIRLFYMFSSGWLSTWLHIASAKILKTTRVNLRIRSSQILSWPIFLQDSDLRSLSCVEHAEKLALHRHSMWSTLVVDILLGNLIGWGLLFHMESICILISNFSKEFTNDILRSGCVWLMGVPAGFKLNTELAGVLGMLSLNAIQIWSTLWFYIGGYNIYIIRALAILGIAFGATIPAALIIDVITFATLHVSALHWVITLLYSCQIQALAALWRLFRGRKWNPLRQRLDSYGYTVKQHIVGSLLFTPLLLLLPTTSVFYIFFTIMNTAVSSICMLIELAISVIHATPYIKIILWLARRRRFPSGIWFEIALCQDNIVDSPEAVCRSCALPEKSRRENDITEKRSSLLVSTLRSNFLSIGQILLPHYKTIFSGLSGSSLASSARGILTGKRMPSRLGVGLPPTMPWMYMPYKEYWSHCRNSIVSCMVDGDCYACS